MSNRGGSQPPFSGLIWATEKNPPTARPRGSGFDESDGTRPEVAVLRQQRRQWVVRRTDCCKWKGVVCDNKKGNMIGLDLSCSGLIGSLQSNSSLFSLQNLRWLNLAVNDFGNSEIPSEFGKLRSLTYLNLSDTRLTGLVPPETSLLSELVSLDLGLNYFFV
ncbi:hypothetical protein PVK06_017868 [Gossypium arboreum]|uniref:Leucine-rich repeat-containing N-terminal plant-type domain-containing protein n=1 Tax=Gossypium arboreum TaxID=29729 RepID=A0ABR0Q4C8_GOSAR|nr:hypothetical protein PVK06_017868 [Gossypium arboreum]